MRKVFMALAFVAMVFATGCKKEGEFKDVDGFFYCVRDSIGTKVYKGNRLLFELPPATSVVKNNDVYSAVKEESSSYCKLSVWKNNNKLFDLPSNYIFPNGWAGACGICYDGKDIFVTCTERIPTEEENKYIGLGSVWKNKKQLYTLELPDSAHYTWPCKPVTVGKDLYIAGFYSENGYHGAVWENKKLLFATEGNSWDFINGIGYHNGNLYYYGGEGPHGYGKIWKNGEVVYDKIGTGSAFMDAIIYNDDIYYIRHGVVWKNGNILYKVADGWVELNSINIVDGDVYVSGKVFAGSSDMYVSKIWKNGQEYQNYGSSVDVYLLKNGMVYQDQF